MSIESIMPSKHLTLCRPLLLLPFTYIYRADRAISTADDQQDSQTAHRPQSKYAFSQHRSTGIWSLSETDKSQEKGLQKFSVTFAFQRDAPQKPTNISLKLFFESSLQTQLLLSLSVRTDVQLLPSQKSPEGLSLWFVWLQENFLSPVAVADKLGYSPGAYITWRDSGLLSREKQLHIPKALPQILPSPPLTQATVIISNGI